MSDGPKLVSSGEEFIRLLVDLNIQVDAYDFAGGADDGTGPDKAAWLPGLLDKFLETCQSDIDPETDDFSSKYSDNIREHWRAYMDGISGGETDLVSAGQEYYKAVSGNIMDGGEDLPEEEMTKAANGLVEVVRACCQEDALDKDAAKAALMPKLQESGFVYKPDTRM